MKISEKPTNWILIKANNNSEVFTIDYCLVYIDDVVMASWESRIAAAQEMYRKDNNYSYGFYYGANAEFINIIGYDEYDEVVENFPDDKDWVWVDYDESTEKIPKMDLKLSGADTKVYTQAIAFNDYGKHDGSIECWSESINVQEIKESYDAYKVGN